MGTIRHDPDSRIKALLALAVAEPRDLEFCSIPDDEELIAFVEGALREERRREILTQLANNPEVYRRWIEIARGQRQAGDTNGGETDSTEPR